MTEKRKRGRPIGGKHPSEIRKVWREYQRKQRSKAKTVDKERD